MTLWQGLGEDGLKVGSQIVGPVTEEGIESALNALYFQAVEKREGFDIQLSIGTRMFRFPADLVNGPHMTSQVIQEYERLIS